MSRKKHHGEHHEEHMDESWLVPYADILTLLLALFIVLFASAQVDQKKFEQVAAALNVAFSGQAMLDSAPGQPVVTQGQPPTPQGMNASGMNEAKEQAFLKESMDLMEAQKKLEKGGFVTTYSQEFQGRKRKYYSITDDGRKQLEFLHREWNSYRDTIDGIIEGRIRN